MHETNPNPPVLTQQEINYFWSRIDKSLGQGPRGTCWRWKWKRHRSKHPEKDYPRHSVGKRSNGTYRSFRAHRLAYFLDTGIWPPEMACHRCDVRDCCNPAHIFPGSHDDNMADMSNKGRHFMRKPSEQVKHRGRMKRWHEENPEKRLKGSDIGNSKLKEHEVVRIRKLFKDGWNKARIAREYHLSRAAVRKIINRQTWAHL